jgi:transposase
MESAIKMSFAKASIVTDRFHIVKLVIDAMQHIKIKYRWIEIKKIIK